MASKVRLIRRSTEPIYEYHQKRLLAERQEFENLLFKEGHRDGCAFAKHAKYRDLMLAKKYEESLECGNPVGAVALSCFVCQTGQPDADTCEWMQTHLSTAWSSEEVYVQGFIRGVTEMIEEIDLLSAAEN
jgi:hypothetical protein